MPINSAATGRYTQPGKTGFIELDRHLLDDAGTLSPADVRSLDAIHVAAALALGDDVGEFVTYDDRLADAARQWGLTVVSPG